MSWEGYERALCRNGHLEEGSDYFGSPFLEPDWRCPHCGEPIAWWEQVDQTNDAGIKTDLIVYDQHACRCPDCGHQHTTEPVQYCIPDVPDREPRNSPLVPLQRCGYVVIETDERFDTLEATRRRHEELYWQHERAHQEALQELGLPDDPT